MGLFDRAKSWANKVADTASDVYDAAANKLDGASDAVRGALSSAWDNIADASDAAKGYIGDALTHAFALGLDPVIIPGILGYWGTLATQAKGRELGIPSPFRAIMQPYFSVNLDEVRYAERISTADGSAVTFGNYIYFPRGFDLDTKDGLLWFLHELRHVQQYHDYGGIVPFLHNYIADIARTFAAKRTFSVHDLMQLEKDADNYRDQIIDLVYWKGRKDTFGIFDATHYLSNYEDLRIAFGSNSNAARNHWAQYGISEGRAASSTFEVKYYLQQYPDLQNEFGNNYNAAIDHWIRYGKTEGRTAAPPSGTPQTRTPFTRGLPKVLVHPGVIKPPKFGRP